MHAFVTSTDRSFYRCSIRESTCVGAFSYLRYAREWTLSLFMGDLMFAHYCRSCGCIAHTSSTKSWIRLKQPALRDMPEIRETTSAVFTRSRPLIFHTDDWKKFLINFSKNKLYEKPTEDLCSLTLNEFRDCSDFIRTLGIIILHCKFLFFTLEIGFSGTFFPYFFRSGFHRAHKKFRRYCASVFIAMLRKIF